MYLNKVQLLPAPNKVHGQCCSFLVIFTNGNGLYLQTERALCYFRPSLAAAVLLSELWEVYMLYFPPDYISHLQYHKSANLSHHFYC